MSAARATYHHGNLRSALIAEAWDMARTHSLDKVTLREVARRVGVSHNAAYRHFADRQDLMDSLAERAMAALTEAMEVRIGAVSTDQDPVAAARARLREAGRAYALFATQEPHLFQVAFHAEVTTPEAGPAVAERRDGPFGVLNGTLDEMVAIGAISPDRRIGAEMVCWASVHGFSELFTKGPMRSLPPAERDRTLDHLLRTVERGLTGHAADD